MKCNYAIWFDTFFSKTNDTITNDTIGDHYPIYLLKFTKDEYNNFCLKIIDSLNKYIDSLREDEINEKYIVKKKNNLESIDEIDDVDDSSLDTITTDNNDNNELIVELNSKL